MPINNTVKLQLPVQLLGTELQSCRRLCDYHLGVGVLWLVTSHRGMGLVQTCTPCGSQQGTYSTYSSPHDTLPRCMLQAVALEGRVYKLLEETPHHGREFAKAVREVLRRETTWVEWKKGKNLGESGGNSLCRMQGGALRSGQNSVQGTLQWRPRDRDSEGPTTDCLKFVCPELGSLMLEELREQLS